MFLKVSSQTDFKFEISTFFYIGSHVSKLCLTFLFEFSALVCVAFVGRMPSGGMPFGGMPVGGMPVGGMPVGGMPPPNVTICQRAPKRVGRFLGRVYE